jgi:hypothetical protein
MLAAYYCVDCYYVECIRKTIILHVDGYYVVYIYWGEGTDIQQYVGDIWYSTVDV